MVSLSNHEAPHGASRATPSWFDKLTRKTISTTKPHRGCASGASRVIRYANALPGEGQGYETLTRSAGIVPASPAAQAKGEPWTVGVARRCGQDACAPADSGGLQAHHFGFKLEA
jgi:hypothetical protein